MKVIFLDIDGVLNEENWMLNNTPWLDENKLKLLNFIQTDKSKGLTEADCINALSILNTCFWLHQHFFVLIHQVRLPP